MSNKAQLGLAIVLAAAAAAAPALTPPEPTHIFQDLHIGRNFELIAAHSDGIFKSVDDGAHWKAVLALPYTRGRSMSLLDIGTAGLLATDHHNKTYLSTDLGERWRVVGMGHRVDASSADGTLWGCNSGLHYSTDTGASWTPLKNQPEGVYPGPNRCDQVLASGKMVYVLDSTRTLHRSSNLGKSWSRTTPIPIATTGFLQALRIDGEGALMADVHDGRQVGSYRSADQGASWRRVAETKPRHVMSVIGAKMIPGPSGRLYTVDMYNIERSDEQGENWRQLGVKGIPDPYSGKPR